MSAKPDVIPESSPAPGKSGKGFIKRNPWVLLVGVFAIMVVAGIVFS